MRAKFIFSAAVAAAGPAAVTAAPALAQSGFFVDAATQSYCPS